MKKVTQVLYSGLGGHGSVVFSIIDGDREKKVKHQLLFFGIEDVKDEYIEKCEQQNIPYDSVVYHNISKWKAATQAFLKIIKQRPDTIIIHSTSIFIIAPLLRLWGIRIITVDHTPNTTKTSREWFANKFLRWFSSSFVYLTKNQFDDTTRLHGEKFHKIGNPVIINNGIDTHRFNLLQQYQNHIPLKIFMQARFSYTKDFQTLIRAAKILKDSHFGKFHIYLAGDGDTWSDCKKLSDGLEVDDHVTFLGMLAEDELLKNLQNSDLYVHSSLSETMSTAIMQALACGLPSIVSDIPGNLALVKDEENGWLFKTQDEHDLANKIALAINGELDLKEMSQRARSYAEQNLSMEKMFNEYYQLI